eukprot:1425413-Rhodomonas_salina.1
MCIRDSSSSFLLPPPSSSSFLLPPAPPPQITGAMRVLRGGYRSLHRQLMTDQVTQLSSPRSDDDD